MLSYLKSYVNMGQAEVACLTGCSCKPLRFNGHHTLRQSTVFLARLLPTESAECIVGVKVLKDTTSGKHKVKVGGMSCGRGDHQCRLETCYGLRSFTETGNVHGMVPQ